jgi:hypothetical protein
MGGMTARERVAQGPPRTPLAGFPAYRLSPHTGLFRAHAADLGPWWFGNDGGGRFDLPTPRGTCYLALDPVSAVRERLGPVLGGAAALPESLLEDVLVSRLRLAEGREVADLQERAAGDFGVTRELETMVPYAVPQEWARRFDAEGLGGVKYGPRFTPGECSAIALFGDEGARDWPGDPEPVGARQIPGAPRVMPTPRLADLNVVRPPRTKATRPQ